MDREESEKDHLIATQPQRQYSSNEPASLLPENPIISAPDDPIRKGINQRVEKLLTPFEGKAVIQRPPMMSGVVTYNPFHIQSESDTSWTHPPTFLNTFDDKLLRRPISNKTRFLQLVFTGFGAAAPFGMAPLTMYLSESIFTEIPVAGSAAYAIIFTVIGSSILPCAWQMWERGGIIGNTLFDHNGLVRSKNDKKPHTEKLHTTVDTGLACCCSADIYPNFVRKLFPKFLLIPIPLQTLSRIVAIANASLRTLPYALLFWDAESYFPVYRDFFLGPLAAMIFEKTYQETLESLEYLFHRYLENAIPMLGQKKLILTSRLKDMRILVNARKSDQLVIFLYKELMLALSSVSDAKQRTSAISLFFLRRVPNPTMEEIKRQLSEAKEQLDGSYIIAPENSLVDIESLEPSSLTDVRMTSIGEAVQNASSVPLLETFNLVEDIGQLPGITAMRRILEYCSVRIPGMADMGRLFVTLWAIPKICDYMGLSIPPFTYGSLEIDPIFTGAAVIGLSDIVIRAAGEWFIQNETFLGLRSLGSRSNDFWPVRWLTKVVSFIPSTFFSLPGPAIIFTLLTDTPTYLKVIISAALFPSDMISFYRFFNKKYGNIITSLASKQRLSLHNLKLNLVRTTAQKRAFLNDSIDRLLHEIGRLDQDTAEQLYNYTQGGL